MGPNFFRKISQNSIHFRNFFQKINVLHFKMVLNGTILKHLDKITHKTPHRLFFENFQKFWKFSKFDPQIPQNSLFIAVLRKKFWLNVLFYRSKNPILCCWDPLPRGRSSPPPNTTDWNVTDIHIGFERCVVRMKIMNQCSLIIVLIIYTWNSFPFKS